MRKTSEHRMHSPITLDHPLIDRQHADLHRSLERLHRLLDASAPAGDVNYEMSVLSKKLCDHFADEEAAMRAFAVPPEIAEAHAREHDRILVELVSLHEAEMAGVRTGLADICSTAEAWILQHLDQFDRPLAAFFKA